MTLRAMGPYNGTLPVPTGIIQGFMRDPATMPFLKYAQLIPAPEIVFSYFRVDPDDVNRLPRINDYAWAYDDYRPTGRGFHLRGEFIDNRTQRWDFPYQIGEATRRIWQRGSGIDPKVMYDQVRANHAALHRAVRVVGALRDAAWGSGNTGTPQDLLGTAGPVYFDQSSGEEMIAGAPNPDFQSIKRTFQRVKRRIHLATNAALTGRELVAVLPPRVAIAMAEAGEIVNFLKQSPYAKDLTDPNIEEWNLPPRYAGFTLVVEDTPRTFINQKEDGTVADVTVASQKDYILTDDEIFFVSRPGGLEGIYGGRNFSTVQVFHFNGEARVEAFSEPKHELMEGHVVMEDKVLVPAVLSGFRLTDVLSPGFSL
jgi:hypothetical protein